jgi:predicted Zn-dependent protease
MKRLIRRVKSWFARQSWTVFGFDLPALLGRFMEYFGIGRLERVIKRWLARRQWKIFWSCLPVLLAAFLSVFILAVVSHIHHQRDGYQQRYHRLAGMMLAAGNFDEAWVASLRGLAGPNTDRDHADWLFYLAMSLNGLGRHAEAAPLLAAAAPLDHPGSLPAHLVVAQSLLNSTNLTSETLHTAERHLLNALALDPKSLEANEMLGRFYINTRSLAKARARLMTVYPSKPDTALLLAVSYDMEKNASDAALWDGRAITAIRNNLISSAPHNSAEVRLDLIRAVAIKAKYGPLPDPLERAMIYTTNSAPQDGPPVWLYMVRDLMNAGKYAPALEILDQAARVSPSPAYPPVIADVCAVWAEKIPKSQNAEKLRLIKKGLDNDPLRVSLRWLLIQAAHSSGDSGREAKKLLDGKVAAATGQTAAWWHLLLAMDVRVNGDPAAARQHLQTAYELAPQVPEIQNDLAMDLATGSPPDLPRALKLIQSALDKFPDNPNYRDTRGRILAMLGRNQEAAADLKFASDLLPDPKETRIALAQVNAALGKPQPPAAENAPGPLRQAHALMGQGKYAGALDLLEKANLASPNPVYADAIADVCAAWIGKIPPGQKGGPAEHLLLIQTGLGQAPQHSQLRAALVQAAHAADDSAPAAKQLLDQLIAAATGDSAAEWHLLLAMDDRVKGDRAATRRHLQTAYELAPQVPEIQNDLAMDLATGSPPDLPRALKLAQSALDKFPDNPNYRNTRGRILAMLGRNQEAAADLEFASDLLVDPKETRIALARVNAALGKPPTPPAAENTPPGPLRQAHALMGQGKYAGALDLLEKENLASPNPAYAADIADVCAAWIEKIPPGQKGGPAERLRLIQKGLGQAPQHSQLRAALVQAAHAADDSAPAATQLLDQLVAAATGDSAAAWHLLLGRDARGRGDIAAARRHFQAAYELAPYLTQAKYELAVVLIAGSRQDWEQGLKLMDPVVDQFPASPEYRFARGRLLALLGRNVEAAVDLELAAAKLASPSPARLALANVYDALGKTKLAEEQRRLAKTNSQPH